MCGVIDAEGFRSNVGIIICNAEQRLLWARRCGQNAWQFPQGGIQAQETPEQAMYRELSEETGLQPQQVEIIASTRPWLRYRLPKRYVRYDQEPVCIGQKQIWYLLRLVDKDEAINLDNGAKPEFDAWRWVSYWLPVRQVVFFKRGVYRKALSQFAGLLFADDKRRTSG